MTTKRSPRTREPLSNALNPQYKLQDQIETWANKQISKINAWEKETKDIKRSYLNWGNFAFFFLVAICADNSLEKHHHKPVEM